ncbi:MAG: hypothetical protein UV50_C0022G0001, partial [Parcubacteria group bacterium GW2011_GWB1_42_9]
KSDENEIRPRSNLKRDLASNGSIEKHHCGATTSRIEKTQKIIQSRLDH